MMGLIRSGAELLLQAAPAVHDTIYTKQLAAEPGWFEKVTGVASGVLTLTIIVLSAALIPAAWNFRKSYKKVSDMLDKIYGDINPLMRHASAIADNVDYISTAIRVDVQQVSQTVAAVNQDRKSTRLNSSHVAISYAVFCLKKKNGARIFRRPLAVARIVRREIATAPDRATLRDVADLATAPRRTPDSRAAHSACTGRAVDP